MEGKHTFVFLKNGALHGFDASIFDNLCFYCLNVLCYKHLNEVVKQKKSPMNLFKVHRRYNI